ncbi:MAG: hypothetical protein ABR956_19105 [Terracidiphilus sp.]|jgi:hypothetical protein
MKTELVLFGRHFKMASRARRRRLVVIFYAAFAALISASWFIDPSGYGAAFLTIEFTIFVGPILGGYLCGWFKPFNVGLVTPFGGNEVLRYSAKKSRSGLSRLFYPEEGFPGIRNDERDLSRRNYAHFLAYRVLVGIVGSAFLVEFLGSSSLHKMLGTSATLFNQVIYLGSNIRHKMGLRL